MELNFTIDCNTSNLILEKNNSYSVFLYNFITFTTVKIINFILSLYLIFLSCIPCADTKEEISIHSSQENVANHEKHSHDTSTDGCSPFCVCNCCGHQVLNYQPIIAYNFSIQLQELKISNYKSDFISFFSGSIWQPPKIV